MATMLAEGRCCMARGILTPLIACFLVVLIVHGGDAAHKRLAGSQPPAARVVVASGEVWVQTPTGRRALGLARYRPWKALWAKVAGQTQLAVGVYKSTRYDPRPHNALFLYDWHEGQLSPRWLGSRLSKPFTDFAFADMRGTGGTELVSIERLADGRFCLVIYRWTGFGFQGEWQGPPHRNLSRLAARGRVVAAWAEDGAERKWIQCGWLGNAYREQPLKESIR